MARNIHPGLPGAIVRSSAEVINDSGELRHSINWTLAPETIREFRDRLALHSAARPPHGLRLSPTVCKEVYKDGVHRCGFRMLRPTSGSGSHARVHGATTDLWPDQRSDVRSAQYEREQDAYYARRAGIVLPPGFRR
jgi:hypothetical protein